jgi:hypothetical protein
MAATTKLDYIILAEKQKDYVVLNRLLDGYDMIKINQTIRDIPTGGSTVPYIPISQADAVDAEQNQTIDPLTLGMTYAIDCTENSVSYILLTEAIQDTSTGVYFFDKSCDVICYSFGNATSNNAWGTTIVDAGFNMLEFHNNTMDLYSTPTAILQQMVNADNGITSFIGVYVGHNCTITINNLCQGWNGVRIEDNNTVTCLAFSALRNLNIYSHDYSYSFPNSLSQNNSAWSGNVYATTSDVNVILPTLPVAYNKIDLPGYETFGGNFYVTPDALGNNVSNILGGADGRNYKIINANPAGSAFGFNIGSGGNIFANTYLVVAPPYPLLNTNFDASDNINIIINGSNALIKSVEIY